MRSKMSEYSLSDSAGRVPGRIEKMAEILKKIWHPSPDLRLWQLIVIDCKEKDMLSIEDDE
jgi:hypothetical protein